MGGRPFAVPARRVRAARLVAWSTTTPTSRRHRRPPRRPRSRRRSPPRRWRTSSRPSAPATRTPHALWRPRATTPRRDLLAGVVANAEAADVRDFTLRFIETEGDGGYADATWRFHGFDPGSAYAEVLVRLADDGDRVAITGFGGGDRVSPLWLSGPLEVRRTDRTLVLVDGTAAEARPLARRAEAAVPVVRRVLPQWRRGLVVEVPGSVDELDAVLDADDGQLRPDRRGHDLGGRVAGPGGAGPRVREPGPLRAARADRRAGGDEPRGDPRGDRRLGEHDAAVAAGGVRRLRRAARRRPAAVPLGRADHRRGPTRRAAAGAPGRRGVRHPDGRPGGDVRERLAGLPAARPGGRRGRAGPVLPRRRVRHPGAGGAARVLRAHGAGVHRAVAGPPVRLGP